MHPQEGRNGWTHMLLVFAAVLTVIAPLIPSRNQLNGDRSMHARMDGHRSSVVVSAVRGGGFLLLDEEAGRHGPAGAGSPAAAAALAAGPGAGAAAHVAVGPAVAEALLPAGAGARGAPRARVPPGRRRQPRVSHGPVRHRHARQHPQPRRRDHDRPNHPSLQAEIR